MNVLDVRNVLNVTGSTQGMKSSTPEMNSYSVGTTVNDATLTIQKNGTDVAKFTANSATNVTANITVPTQASDIGAQPTLVSGTNIKTINSNSLLGSGDITIDSLPSQTGNSGKFLTTDGTSASWATVQAGGGAPTLTWYPYYTENTLTIPGLSQANLVKVYKNGKVLMPGQKDTHIYSAASGSDYLLLTNYIDFNSADNWKYKFHVKVPELSSMSGGTFIFAHTAADDYTAPIFAIRSNNLQLWLSTTGTSWNIIEGSNVGSVTVDKEYDIEFGFTGTSYYVKYKEVGASDWTTGWTYNSTTKMYSNPSISRVRVLSIQSQPGSSFTGEFYMDSFKIILDNEYAFNGADAVSGTDFTNNGCSVTTIKADTYTINMNTIQFTEALTSTDILGVEVF